MKAKPKSTTLVKPDSGDETAFAEVLGLIEQAKRRAFQAVNTELIELYWRVGEYISRKIAASRKIELIEPNSVARPAA